MSLYGKKSKLWRSNTWMSHFAQNVSLSLSEISTCKRTYWSFYTVLINLPLLAEAILSCHQNKEIFHFHPFGQFKFQEKSQNLPIHKQIYLQISGYTLNQFTGKIKDREIRSRARIDFVFADG
jgi:hypothetical protein